MSLTVQKHLQGARPDELVMLRIIEDMVKASAQGVFGCESEQNVNKRLEGCEARFFEEEVQAVLEQELREHLHKYFLYLKTKEIFNLREKSKSAREANATIPPTIPTITVTPPAEELDHEYDDFTRAESENEPTDFSDSTNTLTSIPKKADKSRKKLWNNMEVNCNVLNEDHIPGKDGRFYSPRTSFSPLIFSVNIMESSIRPVAVFDFDNEHSIKDARALANSAVASQYLTQPPMPVMVTVRFPKPSKHPAFKNQQNASVIAELAPATIGQIAKAAILLHATQCQNWEHTDESWKWEAMAVSKKGAKGEVKEIQSLMKSNPVYVRVAEPATKLMPSASAARPQQHSTIASTAAAEHGSTDEPADEKVEESGEEGQKELKGCNDVKDDEETETELARGGGFGATAWAFVRNLLVW